MLTCTDVIPCLSCASLYCIIPYCIIFALKQREPAVARRVLAANIQTLLNYITGKHAVRMQCNAAKYNIRLDARQCAYLPRTYIAAPAQRAFRPSVLGCPCAVARYIQ